MEFGRGVEYPGGMYVKRLLKLGAICAVAIGVTSCGGTFSTPPDLLESKIAHTNKLYSQAAGRSKHGSYASSRSRPKTARDSGHKEALLFVKNTNFRFFKNIGFYIPEMVVSLRANDPSQPVVFDDPQSFGIYPMRGKAVLSGAVLTELMNTHVFNFEGAPLRNITVKTAPGRLIFIGQMNRRGQWVPFVMKGPVLLEKGHMLVFAPDDVMVDNKNAGPILVAANVNLDELLTVKAPGVDLIGSKVYLDALKLFPPPKLGFTIKQSKLSDDGLELTFTHPKSPKHPLPIVNRDSYMMVRGGDVKFLNAMAVQSLVQIMNKDPGQALDFSLYDYRDQLTGGYLKFRDNGAVLAYLKNYEGQ